MFTDLNQEKDGSSPSNILPFQNKRVIAIGGGKGGVGKSMITSCLAISLAKSGKRVIAIDLDLGAANLHTSLGLSMPTRTLSDFISKQTNDLQACLTSTPFPHLQVISGANDSLRITEMKEEDLQRLIRAIHQLPGDLIFCDLGAGTSSATLDFFNFAAVGVLVVLPEPTSIENAYRFIKNFYYRKFLQNPKLKELHETIEKVMKADPSEMIKTPSDLYQIASEKSSALALELKNTIHTIQPKLLINQTRTQSDFDVGYSIKTVSKKYFGIDIDYMGEIEYDSSIWQSIRRKKNVIQEFPESPVVQKFDQYSKKLWEKVHGL